MWGTVPAMPANRLAAPGPGQCPLHLPEIDGAVVPPRSPLLGDGFSVGLDGDYYAEEQERREQGPERDAEVKPQPGPVAGHPDPRGLDDFPGIVEAKDRGNRAAHDYSDYRPPKS